MSTLANLKRQALRREVRDGPIPVIRTCRCSRPMWLEEDDEERCFKCNRRRAR